MVRENARVKDPTGSRRFEHEELYVPRMSPILVVEFLSERATRSCSARRFQVLQSRRRWTGFFGGGLPLSLSFWHLNSNTARSVDALTAQAVGT